MFSPGRRGLAAIASRTALRSLAKPNESIRYALGGERRWFGKTSAFLARKEFILADIGEGITECRIVSWAVKPGEKVEEFDPICEVQSDKATVEITSRFDGIVMKLNYEADEVAKVGSALLELEVPDNAEAALSSPHESANKVDTGGPNMGSQSKQDDVPEHALASELIAVPDAGTPEASADSLDTSVSVAPAVRHFLAENNIDVAGVDGTGKGGRVLKEDVIRVMRARTQSSSGSTQSAAQSKTKTGENLGDRRVALSPIQRSMYDSMVKSLSIPHFTYTHKVDLTAFTKRQEKLEAESSLASQVVDKDGKRPKLMLLPFILKALSMAVNEHPKLNSVLQTGLSGDQQPQFIIKGLHNFGLAVDTPNGLVVPVVRNVQQHSVLSLTTEIYRLGTLARQGKLTPADMKDATLVVSNIGSIGGNVVSPVILSPMTAILAIGRTEDVPAFVVDDVGNESIAKRKQVVLSWSADHRVLDGATVARCAQQVAFWMENPSWLQHDVN